MAAFSVVPMPDSRAPRGRLPRSSQSSLETAVEAAMAFLGVGRKADAVGRLNRLKPCNVPPGPRCNLVGLAYLAAEAPRRALAWFDRTLAAEPNSIEAHAHRALALDAMGETDKALDSFAEAVRLGCADATVFYNHARVLLRAGRMHDAIRSCDMALKLRPAYPDALRAGATILRRLGHAAAALGFLGEAVRLQPDDVGAQLERINLLQHLRRFEDALQACDAVLRCSPDDAAILNNRGVILHEIGRLSEARDSFEAARRQEPRLAAAHLNLGNVLLRQHEPAAALAPIETALRLRPDYPEAGSSRGLALKMLGRLDESAAAFEGVLSQHPGFAHGRKNRGELRLLLGDFPRGLPDYEARLETGEQVRPALRRPVPDWTRADKGAKVAVFADQGSGDIIQFARYLPRLVDVGARVTFVCPPRLQRLLTRVTERVEVVGAVNDEGSFTHQVGLSSLPFAFGTTLETIPAAASYLAADPSCVWRWRERLGARGLKVGLCWRGNQAWQADPRRSFPLACLAPLAALPGVRLLSLQMPEDDDAGAEAMRLMRIESFGMAFDAGADAFMDTAAVMENLDLIVTCDTSIAHLAGALGRPVWVLLKAIPEWRWLLGRDTSPWYPSMRLFRQTRQDDWREPVDRLVEVLRARVQAGGVAS